VNSYRSWHESGKLNMNHAAARALYGALILLILEPAQFGSYFELTLSTFSIDMHKALE
jgi:hypothetical protein